MCESHQDFIAAHVLTIYTG
jgi:hypothetical protein